MATDEHDKLHPENALLAGRIVIIVGVLLVLLGVLMTVGIGLSNLRDVTGSLTLSWFELLVCVAGRMIIRTLEWIHNARWFLFGSFWGVISIAGLMIGLAQQYPLKISVFAFIQAASLFIIWRATRTESTS